MTTHTSDNIEILGRNRLIELDLVLQALSTKSLLAYAEGLHYRVSQTSKEEHNATQKDP